MMNLKHTDAWSGSGNAAIELGRVIEESIAGSDSGLETGNASEGRVGLVRVLRCDEFLYQRIEVRRRESIGK